MALITVPGITQISMYDYRNWGQYWSFTKQSALKMCKKYFEDIKIEIYGNVKTSIAFLYGIPAESLDISDFDYNDEQYQMVIGMKVKK